MPAPKLTRRLFWAAEVLLLAGTVFSAVWFSHPDEWQPLALVVLLLVLAFAGELFTVETSHGVLSASLGAMVLAMGLLGPAPAAACGIAAMIVHSAAARRPLAQWLNNLCMYAVAPYAGGLTVRALSSEVSGVAHVQHASQSTIFGLIVLGALIVLLVLNFALFALELRIREGRQLPRLVTELFLPLLPGELAVGVVSTLLVLAYRSAGLPALFAAIPVLLIFRHLTVALLRSEDRAEKLQGRTVRLVSLQMGVLRTLVRALGMRDPTTARHASAVAHYSEALARKLGCGEDVQEDVRTAGLLHDIGKFTWPDNVLHADVVSPEDQEIVRRHPQDGAELVGALDGYGAAAEAILYHHERVDGGGYPAGLIGKEIPLASRILAICCTYHTMASRGSYRSPMSYQEAMTELRHAAKNGQLDEELVETFIALLDREGPAFGEDTDFEADLEFERRVRDMAGGSHVAAPGPVSRARERLTTLRRD
ncbi:MAG TPA: HD domain-containing phosphohydrolase [Solirubrobacteraceae bacterium]|jgi:putative nucleotidyltransferase with HDIG domain|nr:HD domain-containing phosphohydrolase [Solirubrobacteraceae bacterium]